LFLGIKQKQPFYRWLNMTKFHSWASASRKLTLTAASAFRHPLFQSGTGLKKCRTASAWSGTGSVPASLVFIIPVPDWSDTGQSGIPAFIHTHTNTDTDTHTHTHTYTNTHTNTRTRTRTRKSGSILGWWLESEWLTSHRQTSWPTICTRNSYLKLSYVQCVIRKTVLPDKLSLTVTAFIIYTVQVYAQLLKHNEVTKASSVTGPIL
jgi:hypothetical protein